MRFYLGWNRWGSERAHTVNINVSRRAVCVKTISKTLSWYFLQLSLQYKWERHVSGGPDSGQRGNTTSGSSSDHFTVPLINFGRIQQPAQRLSAPSSAVHGYVCFGFKRKGQILNMAGHWLARAQFTHVRTRRLLTEKWMSRALTSHVDFGVKCATVGAQILQSGNIWERHWVWRRPSPRINTGVSVTFPLFPSSPSRSWTASPHPNGHTDHLFHVWTCLMWKSCWCLLPVSTGQHAWCESLDIFQGLCAKGTQNRIFLSRPTS